MNALKNSLKQTNLCEIVEDNAPSESMSALHKKLTVEIEHFMPLKTYCINPRKARREPWLTPGIHISIRKSKKLYCSTLHKNAKDATHTKFKAYATSLQRLKRQAKIS